MRGKLIHYSLISAIGIAIMLTPAYSASIQQFSNASTFSALTENMTLITFDNLNVTAGGSYVYDNNGLSTSGVQLLGYLNFYGGYYTALGWGVNNAFDWGTNATVRGPGGPDQHLRIVLPAGITAIGMNLMTSTGTDDGSTLTITPSTLNVLAPVSTAVWNTSMGVSPLAASISPTWWGITSDTPIAWLDISSAAGYVVLDNLQFGTVKVQTQPDPGEVPEAATMILIGTGLTGLSLLRRFRLSHAA